MGRFHRSRLVLVRISPQIFFAGVVFWGAWLFALRRWTLAFSCFSGFWQSCPFEVSFGQQKMMGPTGLEGVYCIYQGPSSCPKGHLCWQSCANGETLSDRIPTCNFWRLTASLSSLFFCTRAPHLRSSPGMNDRDLHPALGRPLQLGLR